MRVGRQYKIVNYGDVFIFETLKMINDDDFLIKDLTTLETYKMSELYEYGKGKDFMIEEIDE
ncbi:hypothetical protein [Flammeovirga sp. SubArs3]|nr:hypothetical protein [Flammeovirga sp. SubArs3]